MLAITDVNEDYSFIPLSFVGWTPVMNTPHCPREHLGCMKHFLRLGRMDQLKFFSPTLPYPSDILALITKTNVNCLETETGCD